MCRINGLEEVTMYYNVVIATFIGDVGCNLTTLLIAMPMILVEIS